MKRAALIVWKHIELPYELYKLWCQGYKWKAAWKLAKAGIDEALEQKKDD